jgi:hypothetical protein
MEIAEVSPTYFRPMLGSLINAMNQITSAKSLEDATRQAAVEIVATIAEAAPGMIRKLPGFLDSFLPVLLDMMCETEDDPSWYQRTENTNEDEDDFENCDMAAEILDRVSVFLGGNFLVPALFRYIPAMLAQPEWERRCAAITATSVAGDGCAESLRSHVKDLVNMLLPFFADVHPRVRWEANNAFAQMCTDYQPTIQEQCSNEILTALLASMNDPEPRVRSNAASAVINFCEFARPSQISPYLQRLLGQLKLLLESNQIGVQEQAITAIAAVADSASTEFLPYYDTFMPLLKKIFYGCVTKEQLELRGKAVECISLVGFTVGKEKFAQDANEVMTAMMNAQEQQSGPDDPQFRFLLQAWVRIMRCLGTDFAPFLPYVMTPLLDCAVLENGMSLVPAMQPDEPGFTYYDAGDSRIAVHSATMEEKATACSMLYIYAVEMKEQFFPFIEKVAETVLPLLDFQHHDGVRSSAASIVPFLIQDAVLYFKSTIGTDAQPPAGTAEMYLRNLMVALFDRLMETIRDEVSIDLLLIELEGVHQSLDFIGAPILPEEHVQKLTELFIFLIEESCERSHERESQRSDEDWDEESEANMAKITEKEDIALNMITDCIGCLFKLYGARYLPCFAPVFQKFSKWMDVSARPIEHQVIVCLFDDMIDHIQEASLPYSQYYIPAMLTLVASPYDFVRQACVYGLGAIAQRLGAHAAQVAQQAISVLLTVIQAVDSRKGNAVNATENAISAFGKWVQFQGAVLGDAHAQLMRMFLSFMPLREDRLEAQEVYERFCQMIER